MSKLRLVWLGALLVGCGQYPNPNDLNSVAPEDRAEIANKRLESAESTLQFKVDRGEITDERRHTLIQELAEEMLKKVDPKVIPDTDQWMYAALLRVTDRWPDAEIALNKAVQVAPNPDRKVNDSLKLAQVQAMNKKVTESIATANSILDVADEDAAPILPSVLYEIVPAAIHQGHDKELATLLEKAIECHRRAKVDRTTDAGKAFIMASRYHIRKAETLMGELNGSQN